MRHSELASDRHDTILKINWQVRILCDPLDGILIKHSEHTSVQSIYVRYHGAGGARNINVQGCAMMSVWSHTYNPSPKRLLPAPP